jgi:hypothetical protein
VCSLRYARLAVKGRGGTINPKLLVPRHRLPSKKVLRRCLVHPRSCSLCPMHDGAPSDLRFVAPASPGRRFGLSGESLRSASGKVVEALLGRVRYRE